MSRFSILQVEQIVATPRLRFCILRLSLPWISRSPERSRRGSRMGRRVILSEAERRSKESHFIIRNSLFDTEGSPAENSLFTSFFALRHPTLAHFSHFSSL
jgi:hypothetical protein